MNWNDITLKQFYEIQNILSVEDDYTAFNLIDYLYNVDCQSLPIKELKKYDISFIKEPIPDVKLKKEYTLNGNVYKSNCDITKVTVAQFIDYQNYVKQPDLRLEDLLSVFFLPKGCKDYNKDYDITKVKEDLLELPITVANSIGFFFRRTVQDIISSFPLLFDTTSEEDENGQTEENRVNQQPKENGLMGFGIIPYVLKYCEVTNEPITEVMNESINFVFYIVSYEVLKAKEQEKQLKQIRNQKQL